MINNINKKLVLFLNYLLMMSFLFFQLDVVVFIFEIFPRIHHGFLTMARIESQIPASASDAIR